MKSMKTVVAASLSAGACLLTSGVASAATWWVAENGSDSAAGSESAPFATLSNAFAHASSEVRDTIRIKDGTYPSTGAIFVNKAVEIVGNDADRSKVVLDGETKNPHLGISHADAFVHGITFTRGGGTASIPGLSRPDSFFGCNFEMSAGIVSNCVIKSGKSTYTGCLSMMHGAPKLIDSVLDNGVMNDTGSLACRGGGVKMGGSSELINCIVTNCSAKLGAGVYMTGSPKLYGCTIERNRVQDDSSAAGLYVGSANCVVSNCVIRNNVKSSATTTPARGVYQAAGKIVNSLVSGHNADTGGGVYKTGGSLVNCTVAGNTATTSGAGVYQSGGSIVNTAVGAINTVDAVKLAGGTASHSCGTGLATDANGNFGISPNFRDEANGDYTLKGSSVCVDAGAAQGWHADAKDVSGANARVIDGKGSGTAKVDIGAYEYDPTKAPLALSFSVVLQPGEEFPRTAVFNPCLEGCYGTITEVIWDFGDGKAITNTTFETIEHEYMSASYYTVKLSVKTTGAGPLSSTVPSAVMIKPTVVYLAKGKSATAPFDTPDKATDSIADALAALAMPATGRARVVVADGTYDAPTLRQVLENPIEITGNDANPSAVTFDGANARSFALLNHAEAFVHGIRVYRLKIGSVAQSVSGCANFSGSPFEVVKGVISNCVMETCTGGFAGGISVQNNASAKVYDTVISGITTTDHGSAGYGGGLRVYGGWVENCVISNSACKYGSGAYISGGTIRGCRFIDNKGSDSAGGAGLYISGGTVENCVIVSNKTSTTGQGGGAYMTGGTIRNSLVAYNTAGTGGGFHLESGSPSVQNCTVAKNTGLSVCNGINMKVGSVVNTAVDGEATTSINKIGGSVTYSCSLSLTTDATIGNVKSEPGFRSAATGDFRLNGASACIDAGSSLAWHGDAMDVSGETMRVLLGLEEGTAAKVDIGAYEYDPSTVPASVSFSVTGGSGVGLPHTATFTPKTSGPCGSVMSFEWDFGDGEKKSDGDYGAVSHTYTSIDYFTVKLVVETSLRGKLTNIVSEAVKIAPSVTYVATNGLSIAPYHTLKTAATNIADAISVLGQPADGSLPRVIVADGVHPAPATRITLAAPVEIVGNDADPSVVVFDGGNANPFFYLNHARAFVHGMTFFRGTMPMGSTIDAPTYSYGVFEVSQGLASNCVFRSNTAGYGPVSIWNVGQVVDSYFDGNSNGDGNGFSGGAGHGGALKVFQNALCRGCTFTNNSARWGGGVAIRGGTVENCRFFGNKANSGCNQGNWGGGVYQTAGTLRGALIVGNTAVDGAAGLHQEGGTAVNVTIADNVSPTASGATVSGTFVNSIVLGKGEYDPAKPPLVVSGATVTRCCSPSLTAADCLSVDPLFVKREEGNYALRGSSKCVGFGDKSFWPDCKTAVDLDGRPRLRGQRIDLGAYESDGRGLMLIVR